MVNIDNLFKMISERGISQSKLAENTSISTGNISDWKKGKSMPSAVKLDELATYFDCSVDYLLGRTEEPQVINGNNNVVNVNNKGDNNTNNVNIGKASSEDISEITEMIKKLSLIERSKVILFIEEMKGNK